MTKGRPVFSDVRQNIIDILYFMKKGYGYEIYKHYIKLFPKCTQRLIYYHLKKGIDLGEIEVEEIKQEEGNYSWGKSAEKVYYKLGKNANPKKSKRIKDYFDNIKK